MKILQAYRKRNSDKSRLFSVQFVKLNRFKRTSQLSPFHRVVLLPWIASFRFREGELAKGKVTLTYSMVTWSFGKFCTLMIGLYEDITPRACALPDWRFPFLACQKPPQQTAPYLVRSA